MDNPADLEDVRDVIERPLLSDEERVIPVWLDIAWRKLQRAVKGIPERVDLPDTADGYLAEEDVKDVIVAMVERKVRNPEALRSWSGDDYDQTIDSTLSSGQIYVTAAEIESLAPNAGAAANNIYSIPLTTRP